jgi:replicative DNA helicase
MAEANTSSGGVGREHRPAPHDPDAEAQVIGAALSTASRYPRPNLIPSDFWVPAHLQLWQLITTTQGPYKPCDLPEMLRGPAKVAVGSWTGIDPAVPAAKVADAYAARAIINTANALVEAAYDLDWDEIRACYTALDPMVDFGPKVGLPVKDS